MRVFIFVTTILFCLVVTSLGRVDAKRSRSALALSPRTSGHFRQHHDISTGVKSSVLSEATTRLATIRGGALSSTSSTTATSVSMGALIKNAGDSISSSKSKCWTVLLLTILTETVASTLSKHARDTGSFNKFLAACCLNLLCASGFAVSLAQIEVGIAYASWSALGTAIVSTSGILLFGESCDSVKLVCLLMIMVGVVGLNLRGGH